MRWTLVKMILVLACLCGLAAADEPTPKIPQPDPDAIAKSRPFVREMYGTEINRAKKPVDKAKLAADLLKDAAEVTDDEADRFVLLTMARDFAVDAKARKTAVDAAIAIAERYQPAIEDAKDVNDPFEKAQQLWQDAEEAVRHTSNTKDREKEKLRLQVKAIEWYARARVGATGLIQQQCEKRIEEVAKGKVAKKEVARSKPGKSPNLPPGCVLYFAFEQDDFQIAGQTWIIDRSGCGNHGLVTGNVQPVEGRVGLGAEFDGNESIRVTDSPSLNLTTFTLAAWVNVKGWGNRPSLLFVKRDGKTPSSKGYTFMCQKQGIPAYYYASVTNGQPTSVQGEKAIATQTWAHFAVTFDGDRRLTLYINGHPVSTTTVDPNQGLANSSSDLIVGGRLHGTLDEVLIINKAMSPEEILQLAQQGEDSKKP